MFKKLANKEEDLANWLVERWAEKEPQSFWEDNVPSHRWEALLLKHWPKWFSFSYWYYLLGNLEGAGRYNSSDEFKHWVNWPVWGEWRYLFRNWKGEWKGFKWAWIQLTDETKGRRLICRLRGHPEGEIYYNPGGLEPDHRCKTCGEEIG